MTSFLWHNACRLIIAIVALAGCYACGDVSFAGKIQFEKALLQLRPHAALLVLILLVGWEQLAGSLTIGSFV